MLSRNQLKSIPKVEFHRHLDASIRFETILDLKRKNNLDLGFPEDKLLSKCKIYKPMTDLKEVLDTFWITQKALCNYEAIKRVAFENVEDMFLDGVILGELRFATTFISENKKINNDEIIEGVIDGITLGMNQYPIQVGLIHILPRTLDENKNKIAHKNILKYKKSNHKNADRIIGFDLADLEKKNSTQYLNEITEAQSSGLGITIHSGEDTDGDHVIHTIQNLKATRIGHGIKVWNHQEALKLIKEQNIMLELNPTSNVLTQCVKSISEHPILNLYKNNIPISINSDDPHIMNIDLLHEYELLQNIFKFSGEDFYKINKNSVDYSFLPSEIKKEISTKYFSQ